MADPTETGTHSPNDFPASGSQAAAAGDPLERARGFQQSGDWMEAFVALGRVDPGDRESSEFLRLHGWALEQSGRFDEALASFRQAAAKDPDNPALAKSVARVQRKNAFQQSQFGREERQGIHKLRYGTSVLEIGPSELGVLTQVIEDLRPATLFDLGGRGAGAVQWLKAVASGLGLNPEVAAAGWPGPDGPFDEDSPFQEGDLRDPEKLWPDRPLDEFPRPWLVMIRPGGTDGEAEALLESWHDRLQPDDALVLAGQWRPLKKHEQKKSSAAGLDRFAIAHPVEYESLPGYSDWFGTEPTAANLKVLRRSRLDPLDPDTAPDLEAARRQIGEGQFEDALATLNALKASGEPKRGTDYLRSLCFLGRNESHSACEAAKEELRFFPDHVHAQAVADSMMRALFPIRPAVGGEEFAELYAAVRPYTMLSEKRLYSLYLRTRLVCQLDIPGDLVECGVAAGGGSALIAATASRHTRRPRKLYACDTFEGMPAPTDRDVSAASDAESSGWGSGTCAAPAQSLLEICSKLDAGDIVEPVEGLFSDTLPGLQEKLKDGIAFLHMDGDWYESTRDILVNLYEKVQPKGFIQVDDHGHWQGCREAMDDFGREHNLTFEVNPIDYTGVWLQRPDRQESDLLLLNLGCGAHHHPDWVNLDIRPAAPEVITHDLANEPLPFDRNTCRMVYHSHVLEHLPPDAVPAFLSECHRVLSPEGILRIAVPDLEGIAREYLKQLDAGDEAKHEWMVIELVDQLAREQPGGRMLEYWKQDPMPAEEFVFERMGWEARRFVEKWRRESKDGPARSQPAPTAERIGAFRLGGEVHKWMYDRLSLERLLRAAGFRKVNVRTAAESGLTDFAGFELDADKTGTVRKPDSLFIEARK